MYICVWNREKLFQIKRFVGDSFGMATNKHQAAYKLFKK